MFRQCRDIEYNSAITWLTTDTGVDYESAQYGDNKCLANPEINIDMFIIMLFLGECHVFCHTVQNWAKGEMPEPLSSPVCQYVLACRSVCLIPCGLYPGLGIGLCLCICGYYELPRAWVPSHSCLPGVFSAIEYV